MNTKNGKPYAILLLLLLLCAVLTPFGINFVTDAAVDAILKVSETETESEFMTEPETEQESETEEEELLSEEEPLAETETETGPETEADKRENAASPGTSRYGESEGKEEKLIEEQMEFALGMEAYVSSFSPKLTVDAGAEDSVSDFLTGGKETLFAAVGEYLYSHYGEMVAVDEIELIETVRNNGEECSVQANLISGDASELFILSYDRKTDNYGVYPPYYVN